MAEMTEPATIVDVASAAALHGETRRCSKVLIAVAVFESLAGVWSFPYLFGRASILFANPLFLPEPGLGDAAVKVYVASHPLFALAALAFAVKGRVRHAIVVLGAVEMMRWLNFMTSVVSNGLRLNDGLSVQWTAAQIFIFPLLAACAIALATRARRLGLATAQVSIPTLY